jgi:hypothetical protein
MRSEKIVDKERRSFIWTMMVTMFVGLLSMNSIGLGEEGIWEQRANMPTARMAPGVSVVDGKIYVIGGYIGNIAGISTVEAYDPETYPKDYPVCQRCGWENLCHRGTW